MKEKVKEIEWRDVIGYEGIYKVSESGLILSTPRNGTVKYPIVLIGGIDQNGYKIVRFSKNNKSTTRTVHRIVALAFIPNPKGYNMVNHINGIKTDNRADNLEWCDASYNKIHSIYILGKKRKIETYPRISVVQKDLNGRIVNQFESLRDASRLTGINIANICLCVSGKRKTAGKYIWEHCKD